MVSLFPWQKQLSPDFSLLGKRFSSQATRTGSFGVQQSNWCGWVDPWMYVQYFTILYNMYISICLNTHDYCMALTCFDWFEFQLIQAGSKGSVFGWDMVGYRALRPPSGQEEGADLYFVFEGHFHCLQKGAVVGTISPGMLFGILEVFGISDLSEDMRIRSLSQSCAVSWIPLQYSKMRPVRWFLATTEVVFFVCLFFCRQSVLNRRSLLDNCPFLYSDLLCSSLIYP